MLVMHMWTVLDVRHQKTDTDIMCPTHSKTNKNQNNRAELSAELDNLLLFHFYGSVKIYTLKNEDQRRSCWMNFFLYTLGFLGFIVFRKVRRAGEGEQGKTHSKWLALALQYIFTFSTQKS